MCCACGAAIHDVSPYQGDAGPVCAPCHDERELAEEIERGTRERAMFTLMVPAYVAIALAMLGALVSATMVDPTPLFLPVSLGAGLYGAHGLYTAATQPHTATGDRVRLAVAGAVTVVLLWVLPLLWVLVL